MNAFLRLSMPIATSILAGAAILGVAGLYELHLHAFALVALVPVLAAALWYLRAYAARPLRTEAAPPPPPIAAPAEAVPGAAATSPSEAPRDGEPFEDPVEEADRLDRGTGPPPPEANP